MRLGTISTYAETKKKINAQDADPNLWGLDLEDIEKAASLSHKKQSVNEKLSEIKQFSDVVIFYIANSVRIF